MEVQVTQAIALLNSFHLPLNIQLIQKSQDFSSRQWMSYWAMMECIRTDFFSLLDWQEQITSYSAANPAQLMGPYKVISDQLMSNRLLLASKETPLPNEPTFEVGTPLALMRGYSQVFAITPDQMANPTSLAGILG